MCGEAGKKHVQFVREPVEDQYIDRSFDCEQNPDNSPKRRRLTYSGSSCTISPQTSASNHVCTTEDLKASTPEAIEGHSGDHERNPQPIIVDPSDPSRLDQAQSPRVSCPQPASYADHRASSTSATMDNLAADRFEPEDEFDVLLHRHDECEVALGAPRSIILSPSWHALDNYDLQRIQHYDRFVAPVPITLNTANVMNPYREVLPYIHQVPALKYAGMQAIALEWLASLIMQSSGPCGPTSSSSL